MRFIYTKTFAIFSAFLAVGVLLIFLQVKGLINPVKNIFLQAPRPVVYILDKTFYPVKSFFSTVYRLRSIVEENNKLQEQNFTLQQELVNYDETQAENAALTKELGFVQTTSLQIVPCTVISRDPFGFSDSMVINCGSQSGVLAGQGVISQGFLVGKITSTSQTSATLLLANSSQFSTDAKVSQTGTTAIVRGSFSSGLVLDQLPQTENTQTGELVTTAGISPQIPKDILIGEIGQVISGGSDLFKSTTLLSPIDFKNLEYVFVVK